MHVVDLYVSLASLFQLKCAQKVGTGEIVHWICPLPPPFLYLLVWFSSFNFPNFVSLILFVVRSAVVSFCSPLNSCLSLEICSRNKKLLSSAFTFDSYSMNVRARTECASPILTTASERMRVVFRVLSLLISLSPALSLWFDATHFHCARFSIRRFQSLAPMVFRYC